MEWPTLNEWREKRGSWAKLESTVGAIDGTFTEIYRSQIEPQELYFSGHRHFHTIHTQIVIDNAGYISYGETGLLGHYNDATHWCKWTTTLPGGLCTFGR